MSSRFFVYTAGQFAIRFACDTCVSNAIARDAIQDINEESS